MKGSKRGFPAELHPVHPAALNICLLIWRMKQGSRKWAFGVEGGGEWGWRVVLRGAALHQREGNSLFGTLAGGLGG